jgi:hypothetical protein
MAAIKAESVLGGGGGGAGFGAAQLASIAAATIETATRTGPP